MRRLYPEIHPYRVHRIKVDRLHRIYVEESGNPDGIPVLFLHGGPGSGAKPQHRRYFHPRKYRVIVFDQRGAGRSQPHGEIRRNTTHDLLIDMETIRERLKIGRWLLFGGSWGATLALLYAEQHPRRVLGMILRGLFLARREDLNWFLRDGANRIFPDDWEEFLRQADIGPGRDPLAALVRGMRSRNQKVRQRTALAWARWSGRVVTHTLEEDYLPPRMSRRLLGQVGIEIHYAAHGYFLSQNQILRRAGRLVGIPTCIIHGRRDLTCTLSASWELHKRLPGSELIIVPGAGHLAGEPAMVDALVTASDRMAEALA